MPTTLFSSVILSVDDGVNTPVNLLPFEVLVNNFPPDTAGVVLNDVFVKVGQQI